MGLAVATRDLSELADQANYEHEQALGHARATIEHVFRAGEALIAAKEQVPKGQWEAWLEDNFRATSGTARQYVRLATHRALLPPNIEGPHEAAIYLRGVAPVNGNRGGSPYPDEVRVRVRELRAKGLSQRATARIAGVTKKCVQTWEKPSVEGGFRAERTRRRQSIKERLRARRDDAMLGRSGPLYETYALVRDAVQVAEAAFVQASEHEHKLAIAATVKRLQFAEEALAHAAGVTVTGELPRRSIAA